jgi:hypothetical protein
MVPKYLSYFSTFDTPCLAQKVTERQAFVEIYSQDLEYCFNFCTVLYYVSNVSPGFIPEPYDFAEKPRAVRDRPWAPPASTVQARPNLSHEC